MIETEILEANVAFFARPFSKPLRLSSGPITHLTEARVAVRARTSGREATGRGSIFLSDLWAWPDPYVSHDARDAAMRELTLSIASNLRERCGNQSHHPLELGMRLHESIAHPRDARVATLLARAVCASPFDAAIHDAAGIALARSAFDFYQEDVALPSADRYFADRNAAASIRKTLRAPRAELNGWYILGSDDDLSNLHGFHCFKLKIHGKDSRADAQRTVDVYRAARSQGIVRPRLSVDSNEGNADPASVLDYLQQLRALDGEAFDAVEYLEQPTNRNTSPRKSEWRDVSALKPVMVDEGLTSLELLSEMKSAGWSGLALKTCKGHSFTLVAA
ncbi:MAG TPA: enolase C-terminal domain-like protein, partial [Tepidisphaeraceae bacterium]|nr:enolase C-terminal domain-like protein [Tepidisphaeraceae bacterium]